MTSPEQPTQTVVISEDPEVFALLAMLDDREAEARTYLDELSDAELGILSSAAFLLYDLCETVVGDRRTGART